MGPERKFFSLFFISLVFSLNQTVKNAIFHSIFHPPCFHSNQTYPNGKYSFMLLLNIFSKIILRKYSFRMKLFSHTINPQDKVFLKWFFIYFHLKKSKLLKIIYFVSFFFLPLKNYFSKSRRGALNWERWYLVHLIHGVGISHIYESHTCGVCKFIKGLLHKTGL